MPTTYAVADDEFRHVTDRVTGWRPGDYRRADDWNMPANTTRRIREAAEAAGLDPLPWEGFTSYCERGAELDAAAHRTFGNTSDARKKVIRQLVAGEMHPDHAVVAAAELEAGKTAKNAPRLLRDAAEAAYGTALRRVREWGEQLVVAELAPRVEDLLDEVTTLGKQVPERVTSDRAALAEGGDTADAWNRLAQIHARWQALQDLADTCRGVGLLPPDVRSGKGSPRALYSPLLHRYARADLAEADPDRHRRPAAFVLLHAHRAGWHPGIYTAEQASANLAAINDRQATAQAKV